MSTINYTIQVGGNLGTAATQAAATHEHMRGARVEAEGYTSALARSATARVGRGIGAGGTATVEDRTGLTRGTAAGNVRGDSRDFARQAQGLGGLVHVYATFAANIFAVTAAFSALSKAADVTNMFESMKFMAAQTGINVRGLTKDLVALTDSAISVPDAARFANMGAAAGLTSVQMKDLAQGAKAAATVLGRDVADAMYRLTRATTKIEPELIDELGILVKAKDAYDAYGKSIGKAADDLTGAQRQQAYSIAVIKELKDKYGELFGQLAANPYSKLLGTLQTESQKLFESLNTFLGPVVKLLSENPTGLMIALGSVVSLLISKAIPSIASFRHAYVNELNEIQTKLKEVGEAQLNLTNPGLAKAIRNKREDITGLRGNEIGETARANAALLDSAKSLARGAFKDISGKIASGIINAKTFAEAQSYIGKVQGQIERLNTQIATAINNKAPTQHLQDRKQALELLNNELGRQASSLANVTAATKALEAAEQELQELESKRGTPATGRRADNLRRQTDRAESMANLASISETFGVREAFSSGAMGQTFRALRESYQEQWVNPARREATQLADHHVRQFGGVGARLSSALLSAWNSGIVGAQAFAASSVAAIRVAQVAATALASSFLKLMSHPLVIIGTLIASFFGDKILGAVGLVNKELDEHRNKAKEIEKLYSVDMPQALNRAERSMKGFSVTENASTKAVLSKFAVEAIEKQEEATSKFQIAIQNYNSDKGIFKGFNSPDQKAYFRGIESTFKNSFNLISKMGAGPTKDLEDRLRSAFNVNNINEFYDALKKGSIDQLTALEIFKTVAKETDLTMRGISSSMVDASNAASEIGNKIKDSINKTQFKTSDLLKGFNLTESTGGAAWGANADALLTQFTRLTGSGTQEDVGKLWSLMTKTFDPKILDAFGDRLDSNVKTSLEETKGVLRGMLDLQVEAENKAKEAKIRLDQAKASTEGIVQVRTLRGNSGNLVKGINNIQELSGFMEGAVPDTLSNIFGTASKAQKNLTETLWGSAEAAEEYKKKQIELIKTEANVTRVTLDRILVQAQGTTAYDYLATQANDILARVNAAEAAALGQLDVSDDKIKKTTRTFKTFKDVLDALKADSITVAQALSKLADLGGKGKDSTAGISALKGMADLMFTAAKSESKGGGLTDKVSTYLKEYLTFDKAAIVADLTSKLKKISEDVKNVDEEVRERAASYLKENSQFRKDIEKALLEDSQNKASEFTLSLDLVKLRAAKFEVDLDAKGRQAMLSGLGTVDLEFDESEAWRSASEAYKEYEAAYTNGKVGDELESYYRKHLELASAAEILGNLMPFKQAAQDVSLARSELENYTDLLGEASTKSIDGLRGRTSRSKDIFDKSSKESIQLLNTPEVKKDANRVKSILKSLAKDARDYFEAAFDEKNFGIKTLIDSLSTVSSIFKDMGSSLTAVFGEVGTNIGKVASSLGDIASTSSNYLSKELEINKAYETRADALTVETQARLAGAEDELTFNKILEDDKRKRDALEAVREEDKRKNQAQTAIAQLGNYANLAGATASLFGKHTAAAKALHAVEKALHVVRLAMMIKEAGIELGLIAAKTTAKGAEAGAAALTIPPPFGWVAFGVTMAMLASIGIKMGGSKQSGPNVEEIQKTQSTGTVFGDSSAKSNSAKNSYDLLKDSFAKEDVRMQQMIFHLGNIDKNIQFGSASLLRAGTGMGGAYKGTTGVVRDPWDWSENKTRNIGMGAMAISGAGIGLMATSLIAEKLFGNNAFSNVMNGIATGVGKAVSKVGSKLIGGKTTREQVDSGIAISGSLAAGLQGSEYSTIKSHKKGGYFSKSKTWYDTYWQGMGGEAQSAINMIFQSLGSSMLEGARLLGIDGKGFTDALMNFGINFQLSLQGMSAEKQMEALQNAISAQGDKLTDIAFAGAGGGAFTALTRLKTPGEGAFETFMKIVKGSIEATVSLEQFGITLSKTEWQNLGSESAGSIGQTLLKSQILARESLLGLGSGISYFIATLEGSTEDIAKAYAFLVNLRGTLQSAGLNIDINPGTQRGAGSFETAQAGADALLSASGTSSQLINANRIFQDATSRINLDNGRLRSTLQGATGSSDIPRSMQAIQDAISALSTYGTEDADTTIGVLLGAAAALEEFNDTLLDLSETVVGFGTSDIADTVASFLFNEDDAIKTGSEFADRMIDVIRQNMVNSIMEKMSNDIVLLTMQTVTQQATVGAIGTNLIVATSQASIQQIIDTAKTSMAVLTQIVNDASFRSFFVSMGDSMVAAFGQFQQGLKSELNSIDLIGFEAGDISERIMDIIFRPDEAVQSGNEFAAILMDTMRENMMSAVLDKMSTDIVDMVTRTVSANTQLTALASASSVQIQAVSASIITEVTNSAISSLVATTAGTLQTIATVMSDPAMIAAMQSFTNQMYTAFSGLSIPNSAQAYEDAKKLAEAVKKLTEELGEFGKSDFHKDLLGKVRAYREDFGTLTDTLFSNAAPVDPNALVLFEHYNETIKEMSRGLLETLSGMEDSSRTISRIDLAEKMAAFVSSMTSVSTDFANGIGLTVTQVDLFTKGSTQDLYNYLQTAQGADKALAATVLSYKNEYLEAVKTASDAQMDLINRLAGYLRSFRDFSKDLGKEINQLKVDAGILSKSDILGGLDTEIAALKSELSSLIGEGNVERDAEYILELAGKLKDVTTERFQEEVQAQTEIRDFVIGTRDYLQNLKLSDNSTLTVSQKLAEAQAMFNASVATINDTTSTLEEKAKARSEVTGIADTLLTLGKEYFASSVGYQTLFDTVSSTLSNLATSLETNVLGTGAAGTGTTTPTTTALITDLEWLNTIMTGYSNNIESSLMNANQEFIDILTGGTAAFQLKTITPEVYNQLGNAFVQALRGIPNYTPPSFDVGTNMVPEDMIAEIHRGERIIPAADNAKLFDALEQTNEDRSGNRQLIEEVRKLKEEVAALRSENRQDAASLAGVIENTNDRSAQKVVGAILDSSDDQIQFQRSNQKVHEVV